MKLISSRAFVLLILSLLLVTGLLAFTLEFFSNASTWALHPANRHLYANGKLASSGTIYDRKGEVLMQTVDGEISYHEDKTVRTALMHATGDPGSNVATGAQVVFRDRLSGWNVFKGAYRFGGWASSGKDLTLTLDADLSAVAYRALDGRRGTVGVYNYRTGEILCMVSSPSFDPASPSDVQAHPQRYEGVYLNRFLSARYTPGSIFKLVTAAAAIDQFGDLDQVHYHCEGKIPVGEDMVTCMSAHGDVDLGQSLADSCNVAFAEIALELGANTLQKYADRTGFNSAVLVDGIQTATGHVDVSRAKGANLAWAGIGQYTNTVNPLNFMVFMGAIGNDGVGITPSILRNEGPLSPLRNLFQEKNRMLPAETAAILGEMMRNNTISAYGEERFQGLELCAKSGTAEVGGGKTPHAWFAGFLDRDDYPLAFVVIVENGGSGNRVAGPVAATVLKAAVESEL